MLSFLAVQIYIATIIGGMLINASLPLAFEMGSELAFPVSEGIVGGLLTCLINLSGIIFLLVLLIPDIGMFLSLIAYNYDVTDIYHMYIIHLQRTRNNNLNKNI